MTCATCGTSLGDGVSIIKTISSTWNSLPGDDSAFCIQPGQEDDGDVNRVSVFHALSTVFEVTPLLSSSFRVKKNAVSPLKKVFEEGRQNTRNMYMCGQCGDVLTQLYNYYKEFISLVKLETEVGQKLLRLEAQRGGGRGMVVKLEKMKTKSPSIAPRRGRGRPKRNLHSATLGNVTTAKSKDDDSIEGESKSPVVEPVLVGKRRRDPKLSQISTKDDCYVDVETTSSKDGPNFTPQDNPVRRGRGRPKKKKAKVIPNPKKRKLDHSPPPVVDHVEPKHTEAEAISHEDDNEVYIKEEMSESGPEFDVDVNMFCIGCDDEPNLSEEQEGNVETISIIPRLTRNAKNRANQLFQNSLEDDFLHPVPSQKLLELNWEDDNEVEVSRPHTESESDPEFSSPDEEDDLSVSDQISSEDESEEGFNLSSSICEIPLNHPKASKPLKIYKPPIISSTSGTFSCPDCDATFSHRESYRRHYNSNHAQVNFTCAICNKNFTRKDRLLTHRRRFHKEYVPFTNGPLAKPEHKKKTKVVKLFPCPVCEIAFSRRLIDQHVITHNISTPWKCVESPSDCTASFKTRGKLTQHRKIVHFVVLDEGRTCSVCSFQTKSNYHLKRHQVHIHHVRTGLFIPTFTSYYANRSMTEDFKCDYCSRTFSREYRLTEHLLSHGIGEQLKCEHCGMEFRHLRSLQRHIRVHTGAFDFPCTVPDCDKGYSRKDKLVAHVKKVHTEQASEEGDATIKPKSMKKYEQIPCSECGKLINRYRLKLHMAWHTGEKTKLCYICGRSFTEQSGLKAHLNYVHQLLPPLTCDICGVVCKRPKDMRAHKALHALGDERPFVCEICGKTFRLERTLRAHRFSHSSEKTFVCSVPGCWKTFNRLDSMKSHVAGVHEGKQLRKPKTKSSTSQQLTIRRGGGHPRKEWKHGSSSEEVGPNYNPQSSNQLTTTVNPQQTPFPSTLFATIS